MPLALTDRPRPVPLPGADGALQAEGLSSFQAALLEWAARGLRELPWRRTRDPWAVVVSELMLQQTQVSRVVPRWHALCERWPTPAACAAAPAAEVLRAWAGLGYNRRALSLHRCANEVVERHGGRLPADLGALQALSGIGPYTARAVLAFAFEHDVGVVDTNAARVLARAAAGRALAPAPAQRLADALVPPDRGWVWNSAMLDLGATTCIARRPRCGSCPLAHAGACAWQRAGHGTPAGAGAGPVAHSGLDTTLVVTEPAADPSIGSAGVAARQSAFAGSDRQGRGRLLDALRAGPVPHVEVADVCGWPDDHDRGRRVAGAMVREGFAIYATDSLVLGVPTA